MTNTDWRDRAACRTADPELFFPTANAPGAAAQARHRQAKAVCAQCPVVADCLSWAMTEGLDYGVFGAMTADERRALRRRLLHQPNQLTA